MKLIFQSFPRLAIILAVLHADLIARSWAQNADASGTSGRAQVVVGSFDFTQPDNPYPEFAEQLASYLAAHSTANVAFIDRLSPSSTAPTSPDTWVLNGSYKILADSKIEASLRIERVRGGFLEGTIAGIRNQDLFANIAQRVAKDAATPNLNLPELATNRTEVMLHLERGKTLFKTADIPRPVGGYGFADQTPADAALRKYRLGQAIRSYRSALAIEPDNASAKINLASAYLTPFVNEKEKARDLLNEIVQKGETGPADRAALFTLAISYDPENPQKATELYAKLREKYPIGIEQAMARSRMNYFALANPATQNSAIEGKKAETIAGLDEFNKSLKGTGPLYFSVTDPFSSVEDATERAQKTLAFLEELKPKYGRLMPYLAGHFLNCDRDGGALAKPYQDSIEFLKKDPSQIDAPKLFYGSMFDHTVFDAFGCAEEAAISALELKEMAFKAGYCGDLSPEMRIARGAALKSRGKLAEAIVDFDAVGNRILQIGRCGPWGCGNRPISALALASECRQLLNLPDPKPGFHTALKNPVFASTNERPVLAVDGEAVWLADADHLLQFQGSGERILEYPFNAPMTLSALAASANKLYVGTMGAGLLEFNKSTLATNQMRMVDGLLSEHISKLKIYDGRLWIGYGHRTELDRDGGATPRRVGRPKYTMASVGGVGFMNLSNSAITNYNRPGNVPREDPATFIYKVNYGAWAPIFPVVDFSAVEGGPLYLAVMFRGSQQFDVAAGKWAAAHFEPSFVTSAVAVSKDYLCTSRRTGQGYPFKEDRAIWVQTPGTENGFYLSTVSGLPNDDVTALCIEGKTLWAGGFGYVAEIRLDQKKITRVFTVNSLEVNQIEKIGDHLWIATEFSVFHVAL